MMDTYIPPASLDYMRKSFSVRAGKLVRGSTVDLFYNVGGGLTVTMSRPGTVYGGQTRAQRVIELRYMIGDGAVVDALFEAVRSMAKEIAPPCWPNGWKRFGRVGIRVSS